MSDEKIKELEELLFNDDIVTNDEYELVVDINGRSLETLEAILLVRTGYKNFEEYPASEE